jgi:protein pelota
MKILDESFSKGGSGHVRVVPDTSEDMWQLFNLLRAEDHVEAVTFRKVSRSAGADGVGPGESERIRVKLRVSVESVDYDGEGEAVRVKGRNTTETEHVKLGAYHTLDLDVGRAVKIEKHEWDAVDVRRLREAADPAADADLAVMTIDEGLANLFLVGASVTSHRAKVEKSMPRKTGAAALGYDKALKTFHKNTLDAVLRHVDLEKVKCFVVAGPGFAKDAFLRYADLECARLTSSDDTPSDKKSSNGERKIDQTLHAFRVHRKKIIETHASTAYRGALREVLESPSVARLIKDTKASLEIAALDEFFQTLANKPERALYGPAHVFAAHELGAIDTLLIADGLFRCADANARRRWVALVEEVEAGGGVARVFSSAHESGKQLGELTGVAATLRFPLPDLVDADLPPIEGMAGLAIDSLNA